ncbi:HxsD-like protein [Candidatus Woesearchaeota archaeon]|nr:HxsD-like protein [Candidatus Woesearchaeota archaeon]
MARNQKRKNEVILVLSSDFYNIDSIKEAINDFKGVCNANLSKNKKSIMISLKPKDRSLFNNLGYEFCNYTLALMKNKSLI